MDLEFDVNFCHLLASIVNLDLRSERFFIRAYLRSLEGLIPCHQYIVIFSRFHLTAPWLNPTVLEVQQFYQALSSLDIAMGDEEN